MSNRWIGFLLALALGAALGLYYGWVLNPVEFVDTAPASLRQDYKADFVLLVAEAYQYEGSLELAARRLALLGSADPVQLATDGLVFATRTGYADADLAAIRALQLDLQAWLPAASPGTP